jgi:hypothetical protein
MSYHCREIAATPERLGLGRTRPRCLQNLHAVAVAVAVAFATQYQFGLATISNTSRRLSDQETSVARAFFLCEVELARSDPC